MSDDVTVAVGGQQITGWQEVEVTLRADGFPNSFDVALSSQGQVGSVAHAGAACAVSLGTDVVVTGYVDRDINGGSANGHLLQLVGRGKTCDLVDCSAEWPTHQMVNGDALQIASQIAQAYGITVVLGAGAQAGPQVPQWNLNYGEVGADIIQRVARNAGLLAYEDNLGRVVLGTVGAVSAASGAVYGGNVQAWTVENSMDQRYSEIVCCAEAMDALMELGGDDFFHREPDPNVPRHRQLDLVVETVAADPQQFTIKRAIWEQARRAGRSAVVHVTVDSWRDSGGVLWTPNTLVPVSLPGNRAGSPLILGEVTFRRNSESGTTADLILMPPAAFTPEPIVLQPVNTADIAPAAQ